MNRKLPIGIQGFEKLREEKFLYVDKTEYLYRLVQNNMPYFLSRPRRFGKSLLISTLKAYWEGKEELFRGLLIEKIKKENHESWDTFPVFVFDFNGMNYQREGALEEALHVHLKRWEGEYQINSSPGSFHERFQNLLILAREKTGRRCVILVDEYDKPLLDTLEKKDLQQHNKNLFQGFFSILKSFDEYIQFIFITGVSKFHKISIFSDLNQLNDISMNEDFSGICGITQEELENNFMPEISALAEKRQLTISECLRALKKKYDGYLFHPDGKDIYNPYSLLKAFFEKEFNSYWYETGTPSFLVKKLDADHFDIRKFTNRSLYASEATLRDYTGDSLDPVPLLYQTGYLTIKDYDRKRNRFTLGFPNEEVKYGFLESLMPSYTSAATSGNGLDIYTLEEAIEQGQLEDVRIILTALFASIPYTVHSAPFEHYFQSVIYLVFTLLGKFTLCEMHTFSGCIDCKVETKDFIYLFEFKRDETPKAALAQINDKDYALPFAADHRTLYKIGVSFDSEKRILSGWQAETR